MKHHFVLDTVIFNRVQGHQGPRIDLSEDFPPNSVFVATKVQLGELENTPDETLRFKLTKTFHEINPKLVPATFSFDIKGAGWDEANWSDDDKRLKKLHNDLEAEKSKLNNWQDALIAEVALKYGYWLATADKYLARTAIKHGVKVCKFP